MINNHALTILVDSGSNHSHIDPKVVEIFILPRSKHEKYWLVQLAIEAKRRVVELVKLCPMGMNGTSTKVNLNILPLGSYECLIGMDWLDQHHTILEGHNKAFTFMDEEGNQGTIQEILRAVTV
jgi:hypothetical protein